MSMDEFGRPMEVDSSYRISDDIDKNADYC
jgi:hypothetical protein